MRMGWEKGLALAGALSLATASIAANATEEIKGGAGAHGGRDGAGGDQRLARPARPRRGRRLEFPADQRQLCADALPSREADQHRQRHAACMPPGYSRPTFSTRWKPRRSSSTA